MLRGFYGVASGMIAQQRKTEMLTDNLANVQTPGYKEDQSSIRTFPELLIQARNTSSFPPHRTSTPIGDLATGVYMQERTMNFRQGDLRETERSTDVALLQMTPAAEGAYFFVTQNEDGEIRYTRNGNWTVDGEGFLTTSDGYYILDGAGEPLEVGSERFTVNENGVVTDETGAFVGQIDVAFAEDPHALVKEGNGLLRSEDGELPSGIPEAGTEYRLAQGFLERSNVNVAETMTDLMNSYRIFEANQRMMQAYDQSMQRTVNEVGRLG